VAADKPAGGNVVSSDRPDQLSFQAHVELLQLFLANRGRIVATIQDLLNARGTPLPHLQDRPVLHRRLEDCFFGLPEVTPEQSRLRGQLRAAHRASGFLPSEIPGMHNDLVDPAEMMIRGFNRWHMTRWPGRNGRARYAQTLFNLYVIQSLELLIMRLWDDGPGGAAGRLSQVQDLLDLLWKNSPADQPVLVRDARWLIPVAQSPGNEALAPYFEVAQRVAGSLSDEDRLEIHRAGVLLAGGHLRSQLRHYMLSEGESLTDNSLILRTRRSNALDFAMAVQSLVPMLKAYERACHGREQERRFDLAGAICQGVSPDPELFVNRVDLLGAYTMIEHLFVTTDGAGQCTLTPMGQRHVGLLQEYAALIVRLSKCLVEDCPRFRPVAGNYSPYGVMYGFSNNLLEHMSVKTLEADQVASFSLEDVFTERDAGAARLAWVSGWRKAPHVSAQVQALYEYPQQFAEQIFERIERTLQQRVVDGAGAAIRTGRLIIAPGDPQAAAGNGSAVPELPVQYILSSDRQLVAAGGARFVEQDSLLHDRHEGMYLVSYRTPGGWTAIAKDVLTDILGAGRDVRVVGLPRPTAEALRLVCPGLVAPR
jgi:hypothetical protein